MGYSVHDANAAVSYLSVKHTFAPVRTVEEGIGHEAV